MKIRTRKKSYEEVMALPRPRHRKPLRPSFLLQSVIRLVSLPDLWSTHFKFTKKGMEKVKGKPCLILMNHSCFMDLMIMSRIFYPKPYGIVCTGDGFVGKEWLMRFLGCIPTQKFVSDVTLIRDMEYMLKKKKVSVLMYPEASYSFDGTPTALPRKMGVLLKKLGVPVVTVSTKGAFTRQPLYNELKKRKVRVSAEVTCLATAEEVQSKSVRELDEMLDAVFTFDHFAWQVETGTEINEDSRADGLERILYKCPHCGTEGKMSGKGVTLSCGACGKTWEMDTLGRLQAMDGETGFSHIPDWYAWERAQVRKELENGTYSLETDVDIGMMVDFKAIYMVGQGHLSHNENGFRITGCDGALEYSQGPLACYGLYADYFWYSIADVICIGNADALYYCFPKDGTPVAKTRMAVEELYKLKKARKV